jgi:hypothetical protein
MAVPWLRQLVTGLSPRIHRFTLGSVHAGFVVDKVALGQVSLRVLRFSPASVIPPWHHADVSWEMLVRPLVAAVQRHSLTPSK